MIFHECVREGRERAALAEFRLCHVGLCELHLVAVGS